MLMSHLASICQSQVEELVYKIIYMQAAARHMDNILLFLSVTVSHHQRLCYLGDSIDWVEGHDSQPKANGRNGGDGLIGFVGVRLVPSAFTALALSLRFTRDRSWCNMHSPKAI